MAGHKGFQNVPTSDAQIRQAAGLSEAGIRESCNEDDRKILETIYCRDDFHCSRGCMARFFTESLGR